MGASMIGLLETAAIAVSGFLVKKYVFLEADMEEKKQRIFYWISLLLTAAAFLAFGKDTASLTAVFLIGLNVLLARKKGRLWALFLMKVVTYSDTKCTPHRPFV